MAETKSLYQFMEALNSNNVRTQNLFEMRVNIPDVESWGGSVPPYISIQELEKYLNPNFTYYGRGFTLPNRSLQYQDVGFKGFTVPVPTVMRMTQEHTVTINADIEGNMRRAFLAWQAITMNGEIGPGSGSEDTAGYFEGNRRLKDSGKLYVYLLDPTYKNKDRIIETYTIYGVTVEDVGTMQFSNTEAGLATFDVKFRSQYWQYGSDRSERDFSAQGDTLRNPNIENSRFGGIH